jgi:hypothetical protein
MRYDEIDRQYKRLTFLQGQDEIEWFMQTHAAEEPEDVRGIVFAGNEDAPIASWYTTVAEPTTDTEFYSLLVKD